MKLFRVFALFVVFGLLFCTVVSSAKAACTQGGPQGVDFRMPNLTCSNFVSNSCYQPFGTDYWWCTNCANLSPGPGVHADCYTWTQECGTCAQSSSPPSGGGSTFNPGNCGTSYNPTTYLTTDVINGPWVNSNLVMDRLDTLYIKTVPTTNVEINLVNTSNQTGHYIYCAPQPDSVDLSGSFWDGGATVRAFPHNGSCQGDVTCQARPLSVTFKTCVAPTAPTLNSPADGSKISGSTATLTWNDPSSWGDCKTHNYKVYVSPTSTFSGTPTATITGSNVTLPAKTYNFTGSIGQQYFWKVRASNTTDSPDSAVWSFTLLNPPWWQINNGGATSLGQLTSNVGPGQNLDNSSGTGTSNTITASNTWTGARSACLAAGGDLTTIHNVTENTAEFNLCNNPNGGCWFGYTNQSGSWAWANGTSSYTNWISGQPSGTGWASFQGKPGPLSGCGSTDCGNSPGNPFCSYQCCSGTWQSSCATGGWVNNTSAINLPGLCTVPVPATSFNVPGMPVAASSINLNNRFSNTYNWQVANATFGSRLMSENNFTNIKNRLMAYVGPTTIASSITSASNLTSGTTQDGVYYVQTPADADITIGSGTLDLGSNKVVLLVNGNVTINSKITLTDGSGYFAILASGNITVNPSIGAATAVDPTTLTPHLKGVFIAGNTFDFGGGSNQIRIDGSVVGLTGVSLNRNVLGNIPAEFVAFSPNLFMLTPTGIQSRSVTWQEVNP